MRQTQVIFSFHFSQYFIANVQIIYHTAVKLIIKKCCHPDLLFPHLLTPRQHFCAGIIVLPISSIGHNSNPILSYIKGCRSIHKQFSIDSFLDWEGHHWVFTHALSSNSHTFFRPQHRTWKLTLQQVQSL